MTGWCSHCHRVTGKACSTYAGRARVRELQSCSNMSEVDRYREAAACEGADNSDKELAIYKALENLCRPGSCAD